MWEGHHEGLEHLLHMAHHILASKVGDTRMLVLQSLALCISRAHTTLHQSGQLSRASNWGAVQSNTLSKQRLPWYQPCNTPTYTSCPVPRYPSHHAQPPRLLQRGMTSDARRYGSSSVHRTALHAVSDKSASCAPGSVGPGDVANQGAQPAAQYLEDDDSASEDDDDDGMDNRTSRVRNYGGALLKGIGSLSQRVRIGLTPLQKAERSYHRMLLAMAAGQQAVMGSKAELVLGFCGAFR